MEKRRKSVFCLFGALFLLLMAVLSGCEKKETVQPGEARYTVFYLNAAGNQLVGNAYETDKTETDQLVGELLAQLLTVPGELDCQSAIPARVEKITYRQEANVLYVYADENYAMMGAVQEILCRAALVKTLTQIPGIDYLNIYCGDQPIVDASGNPVGMLAAADFVDSIRNVNSFEKMELTLYFANAAGDKLVPEKREVMQSSNTSVEKLIVEQLIAGPETEGLRATLPEDLKLLNVSVSDTVCSLNFDEAFLANLLDVREYIPIYSIVDSLAELPTVSRVQIRINGSQDQVFRDLIPLNTAFERNYDYVEGGEED